MVTFAEIWEIEEKEKELIKEREAWRYRMKKYPNVGYFSDRQHALLQEAYKRGGNEHSKLFHSMVGEVTAKQHFEEIVRELERIRVSGYMAYKRNYKYKKRRR